MNTQKERRPQARAAVTREKVLAAAVELFCEHGYAATSTRSIAEAAGVTEGVVFHHFGSKEALLLEVATRQHTFAGRVLVALNAQAEATVKELFASIAAGMEEVSTAELRFIAFLTAEAPVNPVLRQLFTEANALMIDAFVARLKVGVRQKELSPRADLEAAVIGFFGGFSFFFAQHRHLPPSQWRARAARFAPAWAEQCWRGIAVH